MSLLPPANRLDVHAAGHGYLFPRQLADVAGRAQDEAETTRVFAVGRHVGSIGCDHWMRNTAPLHLPGIVPFGMVDA